MRAERPQSIEYSYSLRLPLLHILGPCLALLLLTLPFWIDSTPVGKDFANPASGVMFHLAEAPSGNQPADAVGTVHCAIHCAPQVVFPFLLLCAMLLPLAISTLPVYARFHARLSFPPTLPPPRAH